MSRRLAREVVLQSLFQIDFNECEADSALNSALAEHDEFACLNEVQEGEEVSAKAVSCMKAKDYAEKVLNGVL